VSERVHASGRLEEEIMHEPEGTVAVRGGSTIRGWQVVVLAVAVIVSLALGILMGRSLGSEASDLGAGRAAVSAPISLRMSPGRSAAFRVMRHMNELARDRSSGG
jgi:hypothetical protein